MVSWGEPILWNTQLTLAPPHPLNKHPVVYHREG